MSSTQAPEAGFDEMVANLEKTIAKLAEGTAPLEELVAAHARAVRLVAEARARLEVLEERAGQMAKLLE